VLRLLWRARYAIGAPVLVLGGIYSGVFTPTEAGAIGCIYAVIVGVFFQKALDFKGIVECFAESTKSSAMIMFVIAGANLFAWLMASAQIPAIAAEAISAISANKYVFLLLVNILFLFIGSLLDTPAAIVIIVPILEPIAVNLGIDPIHLGAVIVVNFVIGYITAPFGYNLFVTKTITGRGMGQVSLSVMPFLLVCLFGLMLVTYIPQITLTLPTLFD
jgi:C4-dicarboxylate transporter DctM subunit